MKVLGIDPGLRTTGWAVLDSNSGYKVVAVGVVKPDVKADLSVRLRFLHSEVAKIYNLHQPDYVAVEEGYCGIDGRSALKLGMVRGALLVAFPSNVSTYAPKQIKKAVCGIGNAGKEEIMSEVLCRFPGLELSKSQHDIADAIAVCLCRIMDSNIGTRHFISPLLCRFCAVILHLAVCCGTRKM